jgi:hypothetical protein
MPPPDPSFKILAKFVPSHIVVSYKNVNANHIHIDISHESLELLFELRLERHEVAPS